jgi:hypothetical protein
VYEVDLRDIHRTADFIADIKDRITHIYRIIKTRVFTEDSRRGVDKALEHHFTDLSREALMALTTYGEMLEEYDAARNLQQEPRSGNLEKLRQDLSALAKQGGECAVLVSGFRHMLSGLLDTLPSSAISRTSADHPHAAGLS